MNMKSTYYSKHIDFLPNDWLVEEMQLGCVQQQQRPTHDGQDEMS